MVEFYLNGDEARLWYERSVKTHFKQRKRSPMIEEGDEMLYGLNLVKNRMEFKVITYSPQHAYYVMVCSQGIALVKLDQPT